MSKQAIAILGVSMLLAFGSLASASSLSDADALLDAAGEYLRLGNFEQAAKAARTSDQLLSAAGNTSGRLKPLKLIAEAYLETGFLQKAQDNLLEALAIAKQIGNRTEETAISGRLAGIHIRRGKLQEAEKLLAQALSWEGERLSLNKAMLLNNLGILQILGEDYEGATASFTAGIAVSKQVKDVELLCDILINRLRLHMIRKEYDAAGGVLHEAYSAAKASRDSHDKAFRLLSTGMAAGSLLQEHPASAAELRKFSLLLLQEAREVAEKLDDRRALSYADGYLGKLHEDAGLFDEALSLTRRAVFESGRLSLPEGLYLWQWQTGRILKKQGKLKDAADALRMALGTLASLRGEISSGCLICGPDYFREQVEPVYFGLAELLFELSEKVSDDSVRTALLFEARSTIEAMKGAELHDYFRDPCVDSYIASARSLEKIEGNAAVLYVIPFETKLELLLSLPSGIERFTVKVAKNDFAQEVRAFRHTLEKRTTREHLPHGQKLYTWLIAPIHETLISRKIETLVFVPDQWLRTVPLAALHDGRQYLVDSIAVASTQGLTLTDPRPVEQKSIDALIAGITESVQGYPALSGVSEEIKDIGGLYPARVLRDRGFVASSLRKELTDLSFSIVHIASHGEFAGDVRNSFLLAWDERLSMDQLESFMKSGRFRKVPVELLTLSACQSASGDERAALGLAGVAVKAGARSALATLWSVSDEASYQLIVEFYRKFRGGAVTKAKALQEAQQTLLRKTQYQHPYYWAPFILIGNWL